MDKSFWNISKDRGKCGTFPEKMENSVLLGIVVTFFKSF